MILNNSIIAFGEKKEFSIEVKADKAPKKFYLRIWFQGVAFGDFNEAGSLDYIINSYFRLVSSLNLLYEKKFENLTDSQIFDDIIYDLTIERPAYEENRLFDRQQIFCFDFGDCQFNNFTFVIIYLEKEKEIKFLIYEMDGESIPKLHAFKISIDYFFSVYKEFLRYTANNNLKEFQPFFFEGFSYKDIE